MLEPPSRRHLLDCLKPPAGCELTDAVGTSFSLDLMTLLTVPLAFTFFEWDGSEDESKVDPAALLEALRRQAERVDIFCQAGRIQVPKPDQRLLSFLEGSVHEAASKHAGRAFHPKIWVLRFVRKTESGEEILYRFLCLSRNLTFDRCWDTSLVLDGALQDRERAFAGNRPLARFVESLPRMCIRDASAVSRQRILRLKDELLRVAWELPEDCEELDFLPLGDGQNLRPIFDGRERVMIVSPFLSDRFLQFITQEGKGHVLVSRGEALAELKSKSRLGFYGRMFALQPNATPDPEGVEDAQPTGSSDAPGALNGLHAKLYIVEKGNDAYVFTGSANATDAGIGDANETPINVEFLVRMRYRKKHGGIDRLMSSENVNADAISARLDSVICYRSGVPPRSLSPMS